MDVESREPPGAAISKSPSHKPAEGANSIPGPGSSPSRIISVDLLRGLTVMLMIFVNAAAHYKDDVPRFVLHSRWQGLTLADLVFPAFVTLVGVSIPLALHRTRRAEGLDRRQAFHVFWRTVRIVVLGLILTNLEWFSEPAENPFRPWGVLQRIGLVYGACAVLFLHFQPRTLALMAGAMLLLYWPLLHLRSLDGLPTDLWHRGHNFAASLDRLMLGAGHHLYVNGRAGYDPEGLLGTLPAIAHGLIGVIAGEYLIRHPGSRVTARLALLAAFMFVLGLGWHFGFPIVKDLWSSSFVLVTSSLTLLALAALHHWLDHRAAQSGLLALVLAIPLAFGVNAIAAYILHEVAAPMLDWPLMNAVLDHAQSLLGSSTGALIPPLLFVFFVWLGMHYLQRRRWIIKI